MNTLDDRHTPQPKELLKTYIDLARFGEDTGVLRDTQVDKLFERTYTNAEEAQESLLRARELREVDSRCFLGDASTTGQSRPWLSRT